MKTLLREIRHNPLLWLLVFVPTALVTAKLRPEAHTLLFVLAVLANVCYCAAYLVDVPVQYSSFRDAWRRWRWALWVVGMVLAGQMSFYWTVDELNL